MVSCQLSLYQIVSYMSSCAVILSWASAASLFSIASTITIIENTYYTLICAYSIVLPFNYYINISIISNIYIWKCKYNKSLFDLILAQLFYILATSLRFDMILSTSSIYIFSGFLAITYSDYFKNTKFANWSIATLNFLLNKNKNSKPFQIHKRQFLIKKLKNFFSGWLTEMIPSDT